MDSRYEDYEKLRALVTDLTSLVVNLRTIQEQDSLLRMAALPETERIRLIDEKIQKIKDEENAAREAEKKAQEERSFYERNNMINRGSGYSQESGTGDWYFYNPMTIALGKNDFKRKWGRRQTGRQLEKAEQGKDKSLPELTEEIPGKREKVKKKQMSKAGIII